MGAKLSRLVLMLLLALILCTFLSPAYVLADGGAPNLAYIAGAAHGIAVIDIAQQKVTRTIAVAGDPQAILLSLDGRFLYVTQPGLGRVAILAARSGKMICDATLPGHPTLLALNSDGTVLYAAGNEGNISAIDATTCALQRTFKASDLIYGLAVVGVISGNVFSDQLLVTETTALTIFDEKGQLLDSIPIAGGPQFLSLPGGSTAYVTTRQGTVVAVDVVARQVSPPLLTNGKFGPMDYDAVTEDIYVPDQERNQLDVLTPFTVGGIGILAPHEPARVIKLNGSPQAVAITSDGQLGFVALADGKVAMLDIPARRVVQTISVGGMPHFIITGLYPPLVEPSPVTGSTPAEVLPWDTIRTITIYAAVVSVLLLLIALLLLWRKNSP